MTSVYEYIIESFNVDPARIEKNRYGETYPITKNDKDFGRRQNRHVEKLVRGAYQR